MAENDNVIGGETSIPESASPCGCDPGARWVCEWHRTAEGIGRMQERLNELEAFLIHCRKDHCIPDCCCPDV